LSGTNTGVFVGCCFDENTSAYAEDYTKIVGYKQSFAAMVANRYNLNGPSKLIDTACASSFSALHEAIVSLRSNQCDRAIVAGINLCLRAATQMQFYSLNMISPDGHCKCLDETANGYAKGEACVIMILQKKSQAKRIYATVIHTKTNSDGFKDLGITYPSWELQRNLIRDTYSEAGIDPRVIKYCEAHCTGTQAGDPAEMRAICESMCIGL
jgi:fatty acid synthase